MLPSETGTPAAQGCRDGRTGVSMLRTFPRSSVDWEFSENSKPSELKRGPHSPWFSFEPTHTFLGTSSPDHNPTALVL